MAWSNSRSNLACDTSGEDWLARKQYWLASWISPKRPEVQSKASTLGFSGNVLIQWTMDRRTEALASKPVPSEYPTSSAQTSSLFRNSTTVLCKKETFLFQTSPHERSCSQKRYSWSGSV